MSSAQAWLLVGVPALVLGLTLYTSRVRWLGVAGLLVMIAAVLVLATVDRISALVVGAVVVLLYAAGRAGQGAAVGDDPVSRPAGVDAPD